MIDHAEHLAKLVSQVRASDWLAIDTEADSLHAYPEKLCLLQISIPGVDALVDPLAGLDMSALLSALRGRELILHGADYDLRLLYRTFRFVPDAVFDTMLAARFLGHMEFGLTHLVNKFLGVGLEKGPQKMDWAQRPLTPRMEAYARNDTRYLAPLAEILRAQLREKGRLEWHRETCSRLIKECARERIENPDQVWRIKGSDRLDRPALAILKELWKWREQEAIETNTPPYFILSHELLVALSDAAARGKSTAALLPPRISAKRKSRLLSAIEGGSRTPASQHPERRRTVGRRLTAVEQSRFDALKKRRDERAARLELDPTLIASRAALVDLARDSDAGDHELMDWQRLLLRSAD